MATEQPYRDRERLEELYIDKRMSSIEIADRFGCASSTVRRYLKKHGIGVRDRGEAFKKLHPAICMNTDGYVYAADSGNNELVYMHRLLAIAEYGFDEVCKNDVHHENGVPWDNRPENIGLLSHEEHGGLHSREYWEESTS